MISQAQRSFILQLHFAFFTFDGYGWDLPWLWFIDSLYCHIVRCHVVVILVDVHQQLNVRLVQSRGEVVVPRGAVHSFKSFLLLEESVEQLLGPSAHHMLTTGVGHLWMSEEFTNGDEWRLHAIDILGPHNPLRIVILNAVPRIQPLGRKRCQIELHLPLRMRSLVPLLRNNPEFLVTVVMHGSVALQLKQCSFSPRPTQLQHIRSLDF
jgi:hypothetical protein